MYTREDNWIKKKVGKEKKNKEQNKGKERK